MIDHATRPVRIAGNTPNPGKRPEAQAACKLTDPIDGFLLGKRCLILDRDEKFAGAFRDHLRSEGIQPVLSAHQAPDMSAIAERCRNASATKTGGEHTRASATIWCAGPRRIPAQGWSPSTSASAGSPCNDPPADSHPGILKSGSASASFSDRTATG